MTAEEALIRMNYLQGLGSMVWGRLYKRNLILNNPFPVGKIYEDSATSYKIISDCKKIVTGSKRIYYWVQHEGSTTRQEFDERQLAGIEAAEQQLEYMQKNFPNVVQSAKARYMCKIIEIMKLALQSSNAKIYYKSLKGKMIYYSDVMSDKNVKRSQKIRLFAVKMGFIPSKIVFWIHEKLKRWKFG